MAAQIIDFSVPGYLTPGSASDTGEGDSTSIRPFSNGETADQTVLNRSPENLRNRTEVLRGAAEDAMFLQDADRAILVEGAGSIKFGGATDFSGTGIFTITEDMFIRPFVGIKSTCKPATRLIGGDPTTSVLLSTITAITGGVNPPRAYNGANKISVRVTGSVGATLNAVVSGTPADDLTITINTDTVSGTTVQQLITYLNGLTAFTNLGLVASAGPAVTDQTLKVQGADGLVYLFSGAVDAEVHKITAAGLTTFFSTTPHLMAEGDVLCIGYNSLVDAPGSYGGRRQSIGERPETLFSAPRQDNTNVDNNLFLLRLNPEKLRFAIPVAAVSGNELVLVTGDRFAPNIPGNLGGSIGSTGSTTLGLPLDMYYPSGAKKYRITYNSNIDGLGFRSRDINTPFSGDASDGSVNIDLGQTGSLYVGADGQVSVGAGTSDDPTMVQLQAPGSPGSRIGQITLWNEATSSGTSLNKNQLDTVLAFTGGGSPPTPSPVSLVAAAVGVSAQLAKGDHVHLVPTSVSVPANIVPASAGTAGVSTSVARSDHGHPVPVGLPVTIVPNASQSIGSVASLSRSDHIHAIATAAPVSQSLDGTNTEGSGNTFARSSHVHAIPGYSGAMGVISDSAGSSGAATQPARGDHTHQHGSLGGNTDHALAIANQATGAGFISPTDKNKVDLLPLHNNYLEQFANTLFPPSFWKTGITDVTPDGVTGIQNWTRQTSLINAIFGTSAAQPTITPGTASVAYMQFDAYLETEGRIRFDYALVSSTAGSLKVYATGPYNDYSTSLTPLMVATNTTAVQTQSGTQNWGSFITPLLPPGHTKLIFEYIRSNAAAVSGEKCQVGNIKVLTPSSSGVYGFFEEFDNEASATTPPSYMTSTGSIGYIGSGSGTAFDPPGKTGAITLTSGSGGTDPAIIQSARKGVTRNSRWTLDWRARICGIDTVVDFGVTDWSLSGTNYVRFLITNTNDGSGGDNPGFITCNVKVGASNSTATTSIVADSGNYHDYHIEELDDVSTRFYYDGQMIANITTPLESTSATVQPFYRHTNTQSGAKISRVDSMRINTNVKAYL